MPSLRTYTEGSSSGSHILDRQDSRVTISDAEEMSTLKRKNSLLKQKLEQLTLAFDV